MEESNSVVSAAASLRPSAERSQLIRKMPRDRWGTRPGGFMARLKLCPFEVLVRMRWAGAVALSRDAHLSDDDAVAKMGHPDLGHPPRP